MENTTLLHEKFMRIAIQLAEKNVLESIGGPFGAVVVKDGVIISQSGNRVTATNDPTAHAEVSAIRLACTELNVFDLSGCVIYTSCEPCPMCLSAIYWSRISAIYYANTKTDAGNFGFDDQFIYEELEKPMDQRSIPVIQLMRNEAQHAFHLWKQDEMKRTY
ncbi:guanine deaminase [Pedobacter sp. CG_S7]|uniref:nucleoside deaminase n=1 Tax=Pedobacter sp. CG_S7 TaxID=3143930 RepID=UPI0033924BEC